MWNTTTVNKCKKDFESKVDVGKGGVMSNHICPKCGKSKWKTKEKGKRWQCRNCGFIKEEVCTQTLVEFMILREQSKTVC